MKIFNYIICLMIFLVTNAGAFIGNTNNGTLTDSIWDPATATSSPNATKFLATSNEIVNIIYAKVTGQAAGRYKCAIYAGNTTTATTFLMDSAEAITPTNGWYAFPLTASVAITNGQYYYLAIRGNNSSSASYYTTGGTTLWKVLPYTSSWPNPFAQGGSFVATYCIYAIGTVPPIVTNAFANVTLAWDPSPDTTVIGYRIYHGIASGVYTNSTSFGNVTNATITNLIVGPTYFFAATAYDGNGGESVFSNETSYTPPPPTNNIIVPFPSGLRVIKK